MVRRSRRTRMRFLLFILRRKIWICREEKWATGSIREQSMKCPIHVSKQRTLRREAQSLQASNLATKQGFRCPTGTLDEEPAPRWAPTSPLPLCLWRCWWRKHCCWALPSPGPCWSHSKAPASHSGWPGTRTVPVGGRLDAQHQDLALAEADPAADASTCHCDNNEGSTCEQQPCVGANGNVPGSTDCHGEPWFRSKLYAWVLEFRTVLLAPDKWLPWLWGLSPVLRWLLTIAQKYCFKQHYHLQSHLLLTTLHREHLQVGLGLPPSHWLRSEGSPEEWNLPDSPERRGCHCRRWSGSPAQNAWLCQTDSQTWSQHNQFHQSRSRQSARDLLLTWTWNTQEETRGITPKPTAPKWGSQGLGWASGTGAALPGCRALPCTGLLSGGIQLEGVLEVVQTHHLLIQRVQLQASTVVGITQSGRGLGT